MNQIRWIAATVLLVSASGFAFAQTTPGASTVPCQPGAACAPGTTTAGTMPTPPAGPMARKEGEGSNMEGMKPGTSGMTRGMDNMKRGMESMPGMGPATGTPPAAQAPK